MPGSRRWRSHPALLCAAGLCAAIACTPGSTGPTLSAAESVGATASAAPTASASTAPAATGAAPSGWVEAARMQSWSEVARLIDALPAEERGAAEVSYVRARAALALEEPARAVTLLTDLEAKLPLLAEDIRAHRAAAQLEAGPYGAAAAYYAARHGVRDLSAAARAYERDGQLDRARAAADQALRAAAAQRLDVEALAPLRAQRARLAEQQGDRATAALDYRWLALEATTTSAAVDADAALARLAPKQPLTRAERYERALAFARAGDVARTDAELATLAAAAGKAIPDGEVLHARGFAHYNSRSDYAKAAELLTEAAAKGTKLKVKDLFFAARARSRAHDDERAIELYRDLVKRFPGSEYVDEARYRIGHLHYLLGRWNDAVTAYDTYLAKHPRGDQRTTARYERAVAWLAAGEGERAASSFAELIPGQSRSVVAASYRELRGVALATAGKKDAAIAEFTRVIEEEPLSLPALFAAARLRALGAPVPPEIAPPEATPARPALSVALPAKVALLMRLGLDADAERELARHEDAIRKAFAERGHEAVCQAYGTLADAKRAYAEGRRAANWQALERAPSTTSRWLWTCMYPRPYASIVERAERERGLPRHLVHALMRQESTFDPEIVSPARAVGLMQIIPPTAEAAARELGLPYEPRRLVSPPYNIALGTYYLDKLLARFGRQPALAAAAYNAGPGAVSRWLETGEKLSLDVFVARIPYQETRLYVHLVLGNLAHYAYFEGGEPAIPRLDLALPQGLRATPDDY